MKLNPAKGAWPGWVLLVPLLVVGISVARWLGPVMPACLFHAETGLLCPGCGATRSALALRDGRFLGALQNNVLFASGVVLGGLWVFLAAMQERFPGVRFLKPFRIRLWFLWVVLAMLVSFGVLRNFAWFEFLRPRESV